MTLLSASAHYDYLPILIIAGIAWATPLLLSLARMKKIPSVLVEIILGFIIARFFVSGIGPEDMRILDFLAQVGLIFLMFLSGLEIDVDSIIASLPRRKITMAGFLRNPLLVGLLYFGVALLLAYASAVGLDLIVDIPHVWYFALIMVATSLGIVMPVLKERGDSHTRYGQMIIIAASISDFFGIVLFTFTAFIIKSGFRIELLFIIAIFILFYISYQIGQWASRIRFVKRLIYQLSHAAAQIQVRGSIVLILIFVVIAQYIGEEVVYLGAFLSGLVLSSLLHRERSVIQIKLDGMGFGFFIPFFFIMVGVQFDPESLMGLDASRIWFLVALLLSLYALNVLPALLWRPLFKTRKALAAGFLMSSRLSLVIVASAIGMSLGVITPEINASFILLAVVTCFLSPYLFNLIATNKVPEVGKTIIVGGSSTGVLLARRMKLHGKQTLILEKNEQRYQDIKSKGLEVVQGEGNDPEIYREIGMTANDYVVVETGNVETNIEISSLLRSHLQHERVITRGSTGKVKDSLEKLGIQTVDVIAVLATTIENLILRPTTYHALVESFENFSVEEIQVTGSKVDGSQVKEIPFHKDAILMMVKRGNSFYIPHGETYIRTGDVLHVFGTYSAFEDTRSKVS